MGETEMPMFYYFSSLKSWYFLEMEMQEQANVSYTLRVARGFILQSIVEFRYIPKGALRRQRDVK